MALKSVPQNLDDDKDDQTKKTKKYKNNENNENNENNNNPNNPNNKEGQQEAAGHLLVSAAAGGGEHDGAEALDRPLEHGDHVSDWLFGLAWGGGVGWWWDVVGCGRGGWWMADVLVVHMHTLMQHYAHINMSIYIFPVLHCLVYVRVCV